MLFLLGGISSSFWCLGYALFYCGTLCAFHIIIVINQMILRLIVHVRFYMMSSKDVHLTVLMNSVEIMNLKANNASA